MSIFSSCYSVNVTLATTFCSSLGWTLFCSPCWNYKHVTCQLQPLYFRAEQLPIACHLLCHKVYVKIIKRSSGIHEQPAQLKTSYSFPSFVSLLFLLRLFLVKLRKATISSSCLSMCLSASIPHLGSHWTDNIRETRSIFQIIERLSNEQHCWTCWRRAVYTTKVIAIRFFNAV
jgi:hypothetical protein